MAKTKYLYCKNCKDYPDIIVELYNWHKVIRGWTKTSEYEDYEEIESEYGDCELACGVCAQPVMEVDNVAGADGKGNNDNTGLSHSKDKVSDDSVSKDPRDKD